VNYPALSGEEALLGKFIQFRWRGIDYLVFAIKSEHRFHNQILAHFLEAHGLPHHWRDDETLDLDSDDLTVIGGGRFSYAPENDRLEVWDNSQAYGRFDDMGLAQCIHASAHPWAGAKVIIRED